MSEHDLAVDRSLLGSFTGVVSRGDSEHVSGVARMDLASHRALFGRRHSSQGARGVALIDELASVALTGRGGGHFPAAVKWRSVAAAGEDEVSLRVVLAPDRYLSGEATSIIRTIEGGPTLPKFVQNPAQPWSDGGRPILVNNTETMARAGLVALLGASHYVPTSLLTVISRGHRSVVEVDEGHTFGSVIASHWSDYASGEPQAVLLGGYGGSWASWADIRNLRVSSAALKPAGLSIGAGLVGPLPTTACGIEESTRLVNYLAGQSARQCGPCVFGLADVAKLCDDLTAGALTSAGRKRLVRFMDEIAGRGACRHPDGAIRMVTSALQVFGADVSQHRRGRTCNAKVFGVMPLPGEQS